MKVRGIHPDLKEKTTLNTDQIATFDTKAFPIPLDAIVALGVSFAKIDAEVKAISYYVQPYLNATLNMVNGLIRDNQCTIFMSIIADTLGSKNNGDQDLKLFQTAGQEYLKKNRGFFPIDLDKDCILHTRWDDWVNNSASVELFKIAQQSKPSKVRAQSLQEKGSPIAYDKFPRPKSVNFFSSVPVRDKADASSVENKPSAFTSFEVFKEIFDNTVNRLGYEPLEDIAPSYEVALQYVKYMYESTSSPNHVKFKKKVNRVLGDLGKSDTKQLKSVNSQTSLTVDVTEIEKERKKLQNYRLDFLLSECAHHLLVGILARKLRKPIRIFHKDNFNEAFQYIESFLIGELSEGVLALQGVDLQFVETLKAKAYFDKHGDFYNSRKSSGKSSPKRLSPKGSVSVVPSEILIDASIYVSAPETSRAQVEKLLMLVERAIMQKEKAVSTKEDEHSPRYYELSSSSPPTDEIVSCLLKYIFDQGTTVHALNNFRSYLRSQLKLTPTASPESPRENITQLADRDEEDGFEDGVTKISGAAPIPKSRKTSRDEDSDELSLSK